MMQLQRSSGRRSQYGLSLIELMVGLAIALVMSLALVVVLTNAEGRKRTITSSNDLQQAGTYTMHLLDGWIRDAGSGFSKSASYSYGCPLEAYYSGTKILPVAAKANLPTYFQAVLAAVGGTIRLAPILIVPDATTTDISGYRSTQSSDVLIVMGGAAGTGGVPGSFSDFASSTTLSLNNAYAVKPSDVLLLASVEPTSTANYSSSGSISSLNAATCIVEQVSSSYTSGTGTVTLSGDYHSTSNSVSSMSDNATANVIGNVSSNRPPQFMMVGVGDNNTLYSYDLLRTNGSSDAVARADGVFELHALYGIDANCDGTISKTEWYKPTDATYSISNLMNGYVLEQVSRPTTASARTSTCASLTTGNDYMQKILAVRVGLILRTSLPEKDKINTSTTVTLFSDLSTSSSKSLTYSRTLTSDEQYYRYQTQEFTIPLRNNLFLP